MICQYFQGPRYVTFCSLQKLSKFYKSYTVKKFRLKNVIKFSRCSFGIQDPGPWKENTCFAASTLMDYASPACLFEKWFYVFFLGDIQHPYLCEGVQAKLVSHLPFYAVSTRAWEPQTLYGLWKEVVNSFLFLKVRFSTEYRFRVPEKKPTRNLVEKLFPVLLYRYLYSNRQGQVIRRRVKIMSVQRRVKSVFHILHADTLSVKWWKKNQGIFVPWTEDFFICKTPDTIEHVFIYCRKVIFFWDTL